MKALISKDRLQYMCDTAISDKKPQVVYAPYLGEVRVAVADELLILSVEHTDPGCPPVSELWKSVIFRFPYKLIPDKTGLIGRGLLSNNNKIITAKFAFPLTPKSRPGPKSTELVDIHLQIPNPMWMVLSTLRDNTQIPINQIIRKAIDEWLKKQAG